MYRAYLIHSDQKPPCSLSPKHKDVLPFGSVVEILLRHISSFFLFSLFAVNLIHNWQYWFSL